MPNHPIANIGKAARAIARNYRPGPTPGPGKPSRGVTRPYTRAPKAVIRGQAPSGTYSSPLASLRTLTPTVTGTGVTTAHGPGMPGAPGPSIKPPKVGQPINFNTADPNDVVTAEQAPEYAAINSAEHQDQLMGAAQLQAIQSGAMGLSAFIKKEGGTLGQDYVAALALQSGRNNTYQQYLVAQKYADARLEVAAKAPTLYNQELARRDGLRAQKLAEKYQRLDYELKVRALDLNAQAYGLSVTKTNAGIRQADTRLSQADQRNALAIEREKRIIAQYNQKRTDYNKRINVSASKAAGVWVLNDNSRPNLGFANPIKSGTSKAKKGKTSAKAQFTPYEIQTFKAKAGVPARSAYSGIGPKGNPVPQLNWGRALRLLINTYAIPKPIAIQVLSAYYKPGQRGRPAKGFYTKKKK